MSTRSDAIDSGEITYHGKPCKTCGTTEKYTISAACRNCSAIKGTAYQRANRARLKERIARGREKAAAAPIPVPAIVKEAKEPNRFKKPTIEEVRQYCSERGNGIDAQKWFDYYTSNGWKVGKNSMKNWQAAVRTWENKDKANKTGVISNEKNDRPRKLSLSERATESRKHWEQWAAKNPDKVDA